MNSTTTLEHQRREQYEKLKKFPLYKDILPAEETSPKIIYSNSSYDPKYKPIEKRRNSF